MNSHSASDCCGYDGSGCRPNRGALLAEPDGGWQLKGDGICEWRWWKLASAGPCGSMRVVTTHPPRSYKLDRRHPRIQLRISTMHIAKATCFMYELRPGAARR